MTKSEKYGAAARLLDRAGDLSIVERDIRTWVKSEAAMIRSLSSPKRLRCYMSVSSSVATPTSIAVEFACGAGVSYNMRISVGTSNALSGRTPTTIDLAAAIILVTLLTDDLSVAVKLQP